MSDAPAANDKLLFTPGPLTTSRTVKQALLRDLGSRDGAFIEIVRAIRRALVELGHASEEEYTAVPMQGSGTFAVEAVFASCVRPDGKVLVCENGAYGKRMLTMCAMLGIETAHLSFNEDVPVDPNAVAEVLAQDGGITDVAIVHCETTTGLINPIMKVGALARQHGARYFVDAMSSFGAVPIDLKQCKIDYLVSSANKCIEGVPGFGFALCRIESLNASKGWARSLSFDLHAQYEGLEKNGQFRFTPPTHALLGFAQALRELHAEGGIMGRAKRYNANHDCLVKGMRLMGFEEYLAPEHQGYIITSFRYPEHPKFDFEQFYTFLNERGFVIYPGKVSDADCFRIGNIGRIFLSDIQNLLGAIAAAKQEMGF